MTNEVMRNEEKYRKNEEMNSKKLGMCLCIYSRAFVVREEGEGEATGTRVWMQILAIARAHNRTSLSESVYLPIIFPASSFECQAVHNNATHDRNLEKKKTNWFREDLDANGDRNLKKKDQLVSRGSRR